MEKLEKLLKEYAPNYCNDLPNGIIMDELVISKKFGFIKWLVENDKIEFREDFYLEDQHGGGFGEDENIIMLLAIQDEPIRFLCEILK